MNDSSINVKSMLAITHTLQKLSWILTSVMNYQEEEKCQNVINKRSNNITLLPLVLVRFKCYSSTINKALQLKSNFILE